MPVLFHFARMWMMGILTNWNLSPRAIHLLQTSWIFYPDTQACIGVMYVGLRVLNARFCVRSCALESYKCTSSNSSLTKNRETKCPWLSHLNLALLVTTMLILVVPECSHSSYFVTPPLAILIRNGEIVLDACHKVIRLPCLPSLAYLHVHVCPAMLNAMLQCVKFRGRSLWVARWDHSDSLVRNVSFECFCQFLQSSTQIFAYFWQATKCARHAQACAFVVVCTLLKQERGGGYLVTSSVYTCA